jgi:RimJ/RimL family protein N-acetyltransferase
LARWSLRSFTSVFFRDDSVVKAKELKNEFGQPIGFPLPEWTPRPHPPRTVMMGRYCRVEPLDPARHARELFEANAEDPEGKNWTYLLVEPRKDFESYKRWLEEIAVTNDPVFFAIVDGESGKAAGVASFMRIDRGMGVVEVGHLNFSPRLQRTRAATESMFLMMRRAFEELGYRRYEWKCDSLNEPSRRAAERLGFRFEGIFRQAVVYKGRTRDTAWFSIIDSEWPELKKAFEQWLDPKNFDGQGRQRQRLSELTRNSRK